MELYIDQTYHLDSLPSVQAAEFENCHFQLIDFSNYSLNNYRFFDCQFSHCNFSLVQLVNSSFRNIEFNECKLLGLRFEQCQEFGTSMIFKKCILNHSSFYKIKAKNTVFNECSMVEVDFTSADLTGSIFDNCDLSNAQFDQTNLEKTDFTNALNFNINPITNKVRKAKFTRDNLMGLVQNLGIIITP